VKFSTTVAAGESPGPAASAVVESSTTGNAVEEGSGA
jgi:hypothetical protein